MAAKYDHIGTNYNRTRCADSYLTAQLLHHLQPKENGLYLDVGCGTGNYTDALQKKGLKFIGIDPSEKMIAQARLKNPHVDWRIGSAENLDLPADSIDGIVASLTLHHWTNLNEGFSKLISALKPGGRIVVFTSTPYQMKGYWLNHYFPQMLADSIAQMPSRNLVEVEMIKSGFINIETATYSIRPDLEDHFLYCGKHDPEQYFDPAIRHGISSFSSLANRTEVEQGLLQLRNDIDTGKIKSIIKTFENDLGDYLYIIGNKTN